MSDRIGFYVNSTPTPEHVSYVAGALVELLAAGAEHRTSEAIMQSALRVLERSTAAAPTTISDAHADMGDKPVYYGASMTAAETDGR